MKTEKYSFRDAVEYDAFYHVYNRGNVAHLAGMVNGSTYTGYTLCGRQVLPARSRRFKQPVCKTCEKKAQAIDAKKD